MKLVHLDETYIAHGKFYGPGDVMVPDDFPKGTPVVESELEKVVVEEPKDESKDESNEEPKEESKDEEKVEVEVKTSTKAKTALKGSKEPES